MRLSQIVLLLILSIFSTQSIATLLTDVLANTTSPGTSGCTETDTGTNQASVLCSLPTTNVTSMANSEYGKLTISIGGTRSEGNGVVDGRAQALFIDSFQIIGNSDSGHLRISIKLTGTLIAESGGSEGLPTNTPLTLNGCNQILVNENNQIFGIGESTLVFNETIEFDCPYSSNGTGSISLSLFGRGRCAQSTQAFQGGSCTVDVQFGNTVEVLSATILDENMEVIPSATMTSGSGFDYINGFPPTTAEVPNPIYLYWILAGLFSLLGLSRLR